MLRNKFCSTRVDIKFTGNRWRRSFPTYQKSANTLTRGKNKTVPTNGNLNHTTRPRARERVSLPDGGRINFIEKSKRYSSFNPFSTGALLSFADPTNQPTYPQPPTTTASRTTNDRVVICVYVSGSSNKFSFCLIRFKQSHFKMSFVDREKAAHRKKGRVEMDDGWWCLRSKSTSFSSAVLKANPADRTSFRLCYHGLCCISRVGVGGGDTKRQFCGEFGSVVGWFLDMFEERWMGRPNGRSDVPRSSSRGSWAKWKRNFSLCAII